MLPSSLNDEMRPSRTGKNWDRHDMAKEERAEWANTLSDIPGNWIKEIEEKGLPGRDVMVGYIKVLEEMGHVFPRDWPAEYR